MTHTPQPTPRATRAAIAAVTLATLTAAGCSSPDYTVPAGPTGPQPSVTLRTAVLTTLDDFRTEADRIGAVYAPCARDITDPTSSVSDQCRAAVPVGQDLVGAFIAAARVQPGEWPEVVDAGERILTAATLAAETCDHDSSDLSAGFADQCQNASRTMQHAGDELQKALTDATNT